MPHTAEFILFTIENLQASSEKESSYDLTISALYYGVRNLVGTAMSTYNSGIQLPFEI